MYIMNLQGDHFDSIKSGNKIYEIRLNDEKREKIQIGDKILFRKLPDLFDGVVVRVVDKKYYKSFFAMASILPHKEIGFEDKSVDEVVDAMYKFYTKEEELKLGVVALKLEVLQ